MAAKLNSISLTLFLLLAVNFSGIYSKTIGNAKSAISGSRKLGRTSLLPSFPALAELPAGDFNEYEEWTAPGAPWIGGHTTGTLSYDGEIQGLDGLIDDVRYDVCNSTNTVTFDLLIPHLRVSGEFRVDAEGTYSWPYSAFVKGNSTFTVDEQNVVLSISGQIETSDGAHLTIVNVKTSPPPFIDEDISTLLITIGSDPVLGLGDRRDVFNFFKSFFFQFIERTTQENAKAAIDRFLSNYTLIQFIQAAGTC